MTLPPSTHLLPTLAQVAPRVIMTEPADSAGQQDLPAQLWELWRQGHRPDLADFLARAEPIDLEVRVAVLRVDQQQRWLAGERIPVEHYFALYPVLRNDDDCAFELIYCEYLVREELGDQPTLAELLDRFPEYSERLHQQLELHAAIDGAQPTSVESVVDNSDRPTVPPVPFPGDPRPAPTGYELIRELGRGGMGIVYEALDQRTGKRVALKVMQWFDPEVLYRFKQEFRSLSRFSHPNLVSLHELTAEGSQCFFTMELVDGQPFHHHVRGQLAHTPSPLSPAGIERLRAALGQLAEGVNALHTAGVLHRDIKPGNVLVTPTGRVVLLDFGLAAEMDRTGHYLSLQPRLLGTLAYMAPEQAACNPVSPASDWYAVGVMLFEALTGRLPFEGAPFDLLLHKQHLDAPSPAGLVGGLPEDLVRLCDDLLRRDPDARPDGADVRRRLGNPDEQVAPAVPPGGEVPLVGRRQERKQLARAFERTRAGRTVVVSLYGRSGAGKSALLKAFLDDLARNSEAVVLAGRCYEQESVPYKALDNLIDTLSHYLDSLPRLQVEALLPRDVAPLARLFPVLGQIQAVAAAPRRAAEVSDPGEMRRRAVAALRELLARLGDRSPLVLAIDDLQWGDEDSTAVLSDLLLPPDPPVLLLLASFRSEDAGSPCLQSFAGVGAGGAAERVDVPVEPLSEEERRELLQALVGQPGTVSPQQIETIARQSGGFPFFIHELARFLRDGQELARQTPRPAGDLTLDAVLWARVLRLPLEARKLLEVLAVAGRPLDLALALQAAGVDSDALGSLRSERLVRKAPAADGEEIETYHDRIREAVVLHLPADVQAGHHRALAEVLEAADVEPEHKAVHLLGAGERSRAGQYFVQASDRAAAALAFDRAARMYRQALALLDNLDSAARRDLGSRLADALAQARRGAEAAREYLAAATGAPAPQALDLRRSAALMLLSSGHVDAGLSTLREVLTSVGLHLSSSSRRAFWSLVWQRLKLRLRGLRFQRRAESDVPAGELARLDVCMTATVGLSMVDMIQGAHFQSRSLLLALHAGEPVRLACALAREGGHESIAGTRSPRRAARLLDAAEGLANELGEPYPLAMVALSRGVAAALAGEWARAQELGELAERIFRESCRGVLWELGTALRFTLWPLIYQGKLAEVSNRLPGLIQEARDHDDLYGETNLCLVVRTFLRLAEDEPAVARRELDELMERWSHQGFHVQHMNRLYDDAQIDLYEGKAEAAWQRLAEHWPLIEQSHLLRVQQVRIFLGHVRARAALACGDRARLRLAERFARALWSEKAPWARALARLVEAGVASRRREGQTARELLREGETLCEATGMLMHAAAARLLLGKKAAEAEAWMHQQKVVQPERLAVLLVPGAWQRR
jgi:hypothetical protein